MDHKFGNLSLMTCRLRSKLKVMSCSSGDGDMQVAFILVVFFFVPFSFSPAPQHLSMSLPLHIQALSKFPIQVLSFSRALAFQVLRILVQRSISESWTFSIAFCAYTMDSMKHRRYLEINMFSTPAELYPVHWEILFLGSRSTN